MGNTEKKVLEELGCHVEVMWERSNEQRITSGTEVRERIAAGESWKELVPEYVFTYVRENGIDLRIRSKAAAGGMHSAEDC